MNLRQAACTICKSALTPSQAAAGRLCGNALCAWKFSTLPAHALCVVCGDALEFNQLATGTCAKFACRRKHNLERSEQFRRDKSDQLYKELVALRQSAASDAGIESPETYEIVYVPVTHTKTSRLPAQRKRKFREFLKMRVAAAVAHRQAVAGGTAQPTPAPPPINRPKPDVAHVLMHACIQCRGRCCRNGAEHAHLTQYTFEQYIEAHPGATPDAIVNSYMQHVPARTFTAACVYQSAKGCALPGEMRDNTCHRFYCESLRNLKSKIDDRENPRALIVPENDLRFDRVVFASTELVQIVRHRSTTMDS